MRYLEAAWRFRPLKRALIILRFGLPAALIIRIRSCRKANRLRVICPAYKWACRTCPTAGPFHQNSVDSLYRSGRQNPPAGIECGLRIVTDLQASTSMVYTAGDRSTGSHRSVAATVTFLSAVASCSNAGRSSAHGTDGRVNSERVQMRKPRCCSIGKIAASVCAVRNPRRPQSCRMMIFPRRAIARMIFRTSQTEGL